MIQELMTDLSLVVRELDKVRESEKALTKQRNDIIRKLRRKYGVTIRTIRAIDGVHLERQSVYDILKG